MKSDKKKSKKRKHKSNDNHRKKKRKRVSSSSSSSSTPSSSSSSSDSNKKRKIHKTKHRKSKDVDKEKVKQVEKPQISSDSDCGVPLDLFKGSSTMRPETKEEYETRQSQIRRVVDPETGRSRLIKGDGEIIEEIVSRERHLEINKKATATDGHMFQINTVGPSVRK